MLRLGGCLPLWTAEIKSPWQLGAKPELQNLPLLAIAEYSAETGLQGCSVRGQPEK